MNKRNLLLIFIAAVSFLFLFSCGNKKLQSEAADVKMVIPELEPVNLNNRKLAVSATTSIIGDIISEVAGDRADVYVIIPRGSNPHSFSVSAGNVAELETSDVVFVNGLSLEQKLLPVLESLKNVPVVPVSVGLEGNNPHFWFSIRNVSVWTDNIAEILSLLDPVNSESYRTNADNYKNLLKETDREINNLFKSIPLKNRKLITGHADLEYFARDYQIRIIGNVIPSFSDQSEPSGREIAALIDTVKKENAGVICIGGTAGENLKKLARTVAEESGRNIRIVEILTGSLTKSGTEGSTYTDFMLYNSRKIAQALKLFTDSENSGE